MFPHWHYVLEQLFGPVAVGLGQGATHIPSAGTRRAARTTPPPTTPRTRIFELDGGVVAQINSSWAVRVNRDELVEFQVDGTEGSAVAGPAQLPGPAPRRPPKPVWNPDLPVTEPFRDQWQDGARQRRVRQRLQGAVGAVPAARGRRRARSLGLPRGAPRRAARRARAAVVEGRRSRSRRSTLEVTGDAPSRRWTAR